MVGQFVHLTLVTAHTGQAWSSEYLKVGVPHRQRVLKHKTDSTKKQ